MKKIITTAISNPFFSSSFIMIVGSNGINAINYLYHLIMGRVLGPASYGELAAFFSLLSLLSIVPQSFGTVVVKFIASAKNDEEVAAFMKWFNKPVLFVSIGLTIGTILFSSFLANYLNTPHVWGIIIIAVSFLFGLPASLYRSVLQGLIKFHWVVASQVSETSIKLLAGLLFVSLGFGVMGAMTGLLISIITGWFTSSIFLRKYRKVDSSEKVHTKNVLSFTLPVLIQAIAVTSMMSVDLIMVKHYFSSFDAGIYAAVSTMGKIILFASGPVAVVMFPLVTQRYAKGDKYLSMFALSMAATTLVVGGVIGMYFLFPNFLLSMLYGDNYFAGISLLVPYAFFTGLQSLNQLYINFFLSVNQNKAVYFPLVAAIGQIIGIMVYHETTSQIVWVSIAIATLLFIALSVYFLTTGLLYANKLVKK